jgi:hypothetical protein
MSIFFTPTSWFSLMQLNKSLHFNKLLNLARSMLIGNQVEQRWCASYKPEEIVMKLNKFVYGIVAAGVIFAFAAPAQADVLDAWQMTITGDTYSNIGRLSITGGTSNVIQQTDALGNIFVGSSFVENGLAYNISYIANNVVGPGDFGAPIFFNSADLLKMTFSNVGGLVTSITGSGGFSYAFTSGNFTLTDYNGTNSILATGSIVGTTGSFGDNFGFAGANGSSVMDIILTSIAGGSTFNLLDSLGNPLNLADILIEAHTNNQLTEAVPASTTSCGSTGYGNCVYVNNINSNGDAFTVPEPETLALMGLGLLGLGLTRRRAQA